MFFYGACFLYRCLAAMEQRSVNRMNVRLLRPEDAKKHFNLRLKSLQESPMYFVKSYEEKKQSAATYEKRFENPEHSFTFGAFDGEKLVGIITLVRQQLVKLHHRTSIISMYTKSNYRGLGIGKALLEKAIEQAKNLDGVEQIHLTVVTTNEAAKHLYSSFGFIVIGKEEKALKYHDTYVDEEKWCYFYNIV